MRVKDILDKVVKDQPDALAVLVRHGEYDYQNLKPPYDMIPAKDVLETVSEVFMVTDTLEDEGYDIGDMILSFDNHSVVSRKINDGVMMVLTSSLGRPQLIKLQVALGLYTRALEKALGQEDAGADDQPVAAAPEPEAAPAQEPADGDNSEKLSMGAAGQGSVLSKGIGRMFGKAFGGDNVASKKADTGPTDEEIAAAIKAGKKVRHYRGQAYIE